MTVCIAAICHWAQNDYWIVGASDRMLSAPDIKFEPPQQKIYWFHKYAVALVAGDPYAQASICAETYRVNGLKPAQTIKQLAETYADAFSAHRRQIAEAKYLKPLGLDTNSFMDRSPDFQNQNVETLQRWMQDEKLDAAAIIAGIDATGPHLFVVDDPGVVDCADSVAFTSIGSGKSHADSYFMLAHHTRNTPFSKALLDTYVAKKRSEVSPTVGTTATDLFYIGPTGFWPFNDAKVYAEMERIREDLDNKIMLAKWEAEDDAYKFMREYTKPQTQQPATPPAPVPEPQAPVQPAVPPAPEEPSPFEEVLGKKRTTRRRPRKK